MVKYSGELMLLATIGMLVTIWLNWWVVFPFLMIAFFLAYVALGGQRDGKLGPVGPILLVMGIVYAVLFVMIIILYKQNPVPTSYILGFPPATAVLVYLLWPLPLLLALAYALIFDKWTVTPEVWRRFQEIGKKAKAQGSQDGGTREGVTHHV